ncbi:MAG: ankyrin repeat domain-containing protein [Legionella sp.]|uniref:ankyrin repeat domain-containing protein n=1 Tax=Legionella sp. TaxID=459 RepID=UPI00284E5D57|nr:ankyrin repeat domain-containing protein [Legionella sp.]
MPKNLNLVLQKEYLIIDATNSRPLVGTDSLRSCCGVFIYHPSRSAVLHWDDNCCHDGLSKFLAEYQGNNTNMAECTVSIIGGWSDHEESKKSSDFVKQFFSFTAAKLDLTHFQEKKSTGKTLAEQGFSLVYMDATTGKIILSDNWNKLPDFKDGNYRGLEPNLRLANKELQDLLHLQDDSYPDSGSHIYARDNYQYLQATQSNQLCVAAKKNDIPALIKLIDDGVTGVNVAPANTKGWTPLHFACKFGNFEAALLLIQNGADLFQKNDAGSTPLIFVDAKSFEFKQLLTAYRLVKYNTSLNKHALTTMSLFSRHHEQQIDMQERNQMVGIHELLQTDEGLSSINRTLPTSV